MGRHRMKFIGKVIGLTILIIGFVAAWGIIIAGRYGLAETPFILLSSVNAIAVVALAFFTYSYMKATEVMATEMKMTRDMDFELRHRPIIQVDFSVSYQGAIYIEVTNEGNGGARNIALRFEPELRSTCRSLKDFPALERGICYLSPGKRLTFFFDSGPGFNSSDLPKDFVVFSEYEWAVGGRPRIQEESSLQLSPYLRTDLSSYKDEKTLIDEVERIRKCLERVK